jgi:hypothetical protein
MRGRRRLLVAVVLSAALAALAGPGRRLGRPAPPGAVEGQREARLERQLRVARRRSDAKDRVVRRLLAGWLTLPQAAALFGRLNERPEDCPGQDGYLWPGASQEEKLCRQVIAWAREVGRAEAVSAKAVARLERELEALLGRPGGVRLPGPDGEPPFVGSEAPGE